MVSVWGARGYEIAFATTLLVSIALKGFLPAILINAIAIFLPRAVRVDDEHTSLIPRRILVVLSAVFSALLLLATIGANIAFYASDAAYSTYKENIDAFHAAGVFALEENWFFVVVSLTPQVVNIALVKAYDVLFWYCEDDVRDAVEPVSVSLVALWGVGCGITAVLHPSYIFLPLFVIYVVVIGVCMIGPAKGQAIVTWCAKISTFVTATLVVITGLAQNPLLSTFEPETGIVNWDTATDRGENLLVARNVAQFFLLYLTVYVSRTLHNGWVNSTEAPDWTRGDGAIARAYQVAAPAAHEAMRVAVRYRAVWLLPCFAMVCIVGPTLLSSILLGVVFIGCFTDAPFQRFALPLYGFCGIMALGVYVGNIFIDEPYLVQVILAHPKRDGVVIPLVMQAAVNGLVAVSWLLYAEASQETDRIERVAGSHAAKIKGVKASLGNAADDVLGGIDDEWERLGTDFISRDQARRIMERDIETSVDDVEFSLVWGFLTQGVNLSSTNSVHATRQLFTMRTAKAGSKSRSDGADDGEDSEMKSLETGLLAASPMQEGDVAAHGSVDDLAAVGPSPSTTVGLAAANDMLTYSGFVLLRATLALHFIQNRSGFHVFRLFVKHLIFSNTRALTFLGMFLVATAQSQLDGLHLALLVFFVAFAASDRIARAGWVAFMVYAMSLTAFLFLLMAIRGEAFDQIFGQIPEGTRSIAGIVQLPNRWLLLAYFALIFVAAAERATFLHRTPTLRQWLTGRDVEAFFRVPLTRKIRAFTVLGALLTVLGLRVVFERHSLFMLGYVLLFIISCYTFTFSKSFIGALRGLWGFGIVYGSLCLLALAVYQFREVHSNVDDAMGLNTTTSKCSGLCPADVGLTRPTDGDPLTLLLLPSFLTVSLITILFMMLNNFFEDLALPTDANDFEFLFETLRDFLNFTLDLLRKAKDALMDNMYVAVWLSLFVGAVSNVSLLSGVYVFMFIIDVRGRVPLLYSSLHMVVVYVCRFVFVTSRLSDDELLELEYLGLARRDAHLHTNIVIGPMVVFVTSLVYLNASGTQFKVGQRRKTMGPQPGSASQARFHGGDSDAFVEATEAPINGGGSDAGSERGSAKSNEPSLFRELVDSIVAAPRQLSYETLLLVHMVGSAVSVRRASGFIHVLLVSLIAQLRRRQVTGNNVAIKVILAIEMVLQVATYALIVNIPPHYLTGPNPFVPESQLSEWARYAGFLAPSADPLMFFLAAVVVRFIDAGQDLVGHEIAEAEGQTGFACMYDLLRAKSEEVAECFAGTRPSFDDVLPPSDAIEEPNTVQRGVARAMCFVMPPAVLTFVYGAGHLSFINTVICLSGMLMMAHRAKILWGTTTMWPKWEMFCNGFQYLVVICNLPPVASAILREHTFTFSFGLMDDDGEVLGLSALRICLLWSAYLQRRVFDSFFFVTILRELHDEQLNRLERNKELQLYLQSVEDREFAEADKRAAVRQRRLEEIRAARRGEALDHLDEPLLKVPAADDNDDGAAKDGHGEHAPTGAAAALPAKEEGDVKDEADIDAQEDQEFEEWAMVADDAGKDGKGDEDEEKKKTMKERFHEFLVWATVHLGRRSRITKEELAKLPTVERRFIAAFVSFWSLHTALLCYVSFSVNFVGTGSLFNGILAMSGLVYAFLMTPWPLRKYWTFCLIYTTIGIVFKSTVALTHQRQSFNEHERRLLSLLIAPVSEGTETGTIFLDLFGDFINFGLVLFHLQVCSNNGTYADDSATPKGVLETIQTRVGCGVDLYTVCLCLESAALAILVGFYYSLVGLTHGSFLDSVQSNLLPGPLVVAMLSSVLLMTIDRILYITGSPRAKFGFNALLVVGFHVAYVFWREVPRTNVPAGMAYFLVKLMYFFCSAYQLRYGYPKFRRHDPFKAHPRAPVSLFYTVYYSMPFLWELRVLLDWTFTRTTLRFKYWVKLEDAQNETYMRRVDENVLLPPGTPIPPKAKGLQGGLIYFVLVFMLFFPLLMYSTFNPALVANYMTNVEISGSFGALSTWYEAGMLSSTDLPATYYEYFEHTNPRIAQEVEGTGKTMQLLSMPHCSAESWDVSPSAREALHDAFNKSFYNVTELDIRLTMKFTRRYFTQNSERMEELRTEVPIPWYDSVALERFVDGTVNHVSVIVPFFYSPYIDNKPDKVLRFKDQQQHLKSSCALNFSLVYDPIIQSHIRYTCLECTPMFEGGNFPDPSYPGWECIQYGRNCGTYHSPTSSSGHASTTHTTENMFFFVVSDMVPNDAGVLPNIGIIALYTTFILAIGQVLRGAWAGTANMTHLQDMQDPERVDDLIESILLCQASGETKDLELEGLLYFELIDLLRSSEALLNVTGARAEAYRRKLKAV